MDGELKKQFRKNFPDYDGGFSSISYNDHLLRQNFEPEETLERRKSVRFTEESHERHEYQKRRQQASFFLAKKLRRAGAILSDWLYLAILGIVVAFISSGVDACSFYSGKLIMWISFALPRDYPSWGRWASYLMWITFTTALVAAAATFVHFVSPQAIGSGIPEMKTMIRGVILRDYLSFRTLISKIGGLAMALSSGLPIGKAGPFVHISSVVADKMSQIAARLDPSFSNEARRFENLAAACAVGVACTFSAPVGGVLFSIEVTTMYFSVNNFWRGFFASCCGAITFRLLRGFLQRTDVTVNAYFQTDFSKDAFVVDELLFFALLGAMCGIMGSAYIKLYHKLVIFLRTDKIAKALFQRHWIVYPLLISFVYAFLTYPHGLGRYLAGRIRFGWNLRDFFSDCSFKFTPSECRYDILERWVNREHDILVLLSLFILTLFFSTIICQTIPIPSGIFGPSFALGAALGRLMGELVYMAFPDGIRRGFHIHPGAYAVVGAAAFSASVTHSVSVSVMIFEITGQLHLILPVMIATIISNAICSYLTPSWFDTIIQIKHLPFLPDIPPSSTRVHEILAEDIMTSPVLSLTRETTFEEIRSALLRGMDLSVFPVIDSPKNNILVGTVTRRLLLQMLESQVGDSARAAEAERRVHKAIETIDSHFKSSSPDKEDESADEGDNEVSLAVASHASAENTDVDSSGPSYSASSAENTPVNINEVYVPTIPDDVDTRRRCSNFQRRNALFAVGRAPMEGTRSSFVSVHSELPMLSPDYVSTIKGQTKTPESKIMEKPSEKLLLQPDAMCCIFYARQAKQFMKRMQKGRRDKETTDATVFDLNAVELSSYSGEEALQQIGTTIKIYSREDWELDQLSKAVVFSDKHLDAAPFQLVRKTSLHKIHSIFSMLQLNKAYVIDCGRLVGVVALCDVRQALEGTIPRATPLPSEVSAKPIQAGRHPSLQMLVVKPRVHDVLTPTLEVVTATAETHEKAFVRRESESLRRRPSDRPRMRQASIFDHRRTLQTSQAEQLAEAVTYLRRKSLTLRRMSDTRSD